MAAKKSMSGPLGGVLVFIGSLIYLYVIFTWYSRGAAMGSWLSMAQFFAPFVIAASIVSAITLFFMSFGTMGGMMGEMMSNLIWKFIMISGITTLIITGGGSWFYVALAGFVLTYIGGTMSTMDMMK